jgi:regulatory protein
MPDDAYARALRLLGQRAHLRAELRRKLLQRGYDAADVEAALDRCAEQGYLDDEATAAALAREGQSRRGWGSAKVKAELVRRGASAEAIGAALATSSDEEETARARAVAAQWLRRSSKGGDWRPSLARHLDRKGFSRRAIVAALQDAGAAGDLDDLEPVAEPAD